MATENIEWELEEGIPQVEDPFIQQYLRGRDSLVQQEQKQRHDANLRRALSPAAAQACKVISRIRARELRDQWRGRERHGPRADEAVTSTLNEQEESALWKIIRRFPKGSLLHAYLNAMVDVDWLIDEALSTPGIHLCASRPILTAGDFQDVDLKFRYLPHLPHQGKKVEDEASLWMSTYKPETPVPFKEALEHGESSFRSQLKSRLSFTPDNLEYYRKRGAHAAGDFFLDSERIVNSLLCCEPILRRSLRRIFAQLAADAISYVEFRNLFSQPLTREGAISPDDDYSGWCRVFHEEVERFKGTEEGKNFYGARIIWTVERSESKEYIVQSMKLCILAKSEFPDVICGFDLFGPEDDGRTLKELTPLLFWFRKLCFEEGVDIPFFFQAGETPADDTSADGNLFDATLLGTRRISRADTLYKHPLLLDLIKEKKILVECCPSSSQVPGLPDSVHYHPLEALVSRGVPVALGCDAPAFRGQSSIGLTPDFWRVLQAFGSMGLTDLAIMAENSVQWSCYEDQPTGAWLSDIQDSVLGDGIKSSRLQAWWKEFEAFCQWVVQEFADDNVEE